MEMKMRFAAAALAGLLLGPGHAPAMPILQFARMNLDDQASYVSSLVEGSAKYLRAQGHPDQAQKAIDLFKDSTSHGGVSQMAQALRKMQSENDRNSTNPNNRVPPYDVEAGLAEVLLQNGIRVPLDYLEKVNHGFQPLLPPRAHVGGP